MALSVGAPQRWAQRAQSEQTRHRPSQLKAHRHPRPHATLASKTPLVVNAAKPDKDNKWTGLRVSYQGVPGAYSEQASLLAYDGCTPAPFDQFENAFEAVEQFLVERAVLPIENSLGGSIHRNFDLLLKHRLHIVGEVYLKVNHCLMALPGTTMGDVKRVMSHPQALSQCDGYLTRMGVVKEAVDDTAGAAKMIAAGQMRECAAVASSRAAELYGLEVLDSGIQDDQDNFTRFIALSREPIQPAAGPTCQYKTSIVFSLGEGAGELFKALSCFALRGIDLTKIESRPMRSHPVTVTTAESGEPGEVLQFSYLFYVDLAASTADTNAQNALRHLQEMAPFMRVLGCYKSDIRRRETK